VLQIVPFQWQVLEVQGLFSDSTRPSQQLSASQEILLPGFIGFFLSSNFLLSIHL
jgi:hypothetical protein